MASNSIKESEVLSQIKKLSVPEKILIVEDIWDSITLSNEELSVTEKQKKDLDKRLTDYENAQTGGSDWSEVKNRIESKL
ncbi:MAG: addiction module protein [Ignavibacteria bacterium]|nr:addiction module protein [Ignavibacteria bacterium]